MTATIRSVGFDALYLAPGVSGGTETYLRELLPVMAGRHPGVRFTVITTPSGAHALKGSDLADAVAIRSLPAEDAQRVRRVLTEQTLLPVLGLRQGWDLIHGLGNRAPIWGRGAIVLTLHDLIFLRDQSLAGVPRKVLEFLTVRALRRADGVITLTRAVSDDICASAALDRSKVSVIPHGVGRGAPTAAADEGSVREKFRLAGARVVLCVAAKRPHKNQELLLRALEYLPDDVVVLCAGHDDGYEPRLRELTAELDIGARVRLPGYVDDDELETLWRVASCAAFPTLAEGFGLPILEAMRRGVPVACSDIAVLREVGGSAATYFDPADPRAAAAAIDASLGNADMAAAGRARAAAYSWEAAADATFEAYERALHRHSR